MACRVFAARVPSILIVAMLVAQPQRHAALPAKADAPQRTSIASEGRRGCSDQVRGQAAAPSVWTGPWRSLRMQQRAVLHRGVLPDDRVGDRGFQAGGAFPLLGRAHAAVTADLVDVPIDLQVVAV